MRKIFLAIAILVLLVCPAYAEIFYTFTNSPNTPAPVTPSNYEIVYGTPATPSSINDKFYHIDLRLDDRETGSSEWDSEARLEAHWGVDIFTTIGNDWTEAELEAGLSDVLNVIIAAEINTFALIQALVADKTLVNEEDSPDFSVATSLRIPSAADVSANILDGMISWNNILKTLYIGDGTNAIPFGGGSEILNELTINYTVPSTASSVFAALNIQLDVGSGPLDASSEVHGICIAATGATSGHITGLGTHGAVHPIHQHIGTFLTPDQSTPDAYAGLFPDGGSFDDGVDGKTVLPGDDDEIYFGSATVFSELEVILSTPSSSHISQSGGIVIEYQHTDTTWDSFIPVDGTNGFQQNGIIVWNSGDLTNWKSDSDPGGGDTAAGYWIRIRRTRNNIGTDAIATTIKTLEPDEMGWDDNADLTVEGINAAGVVDFGDATSTEIVNAEGDATLTALGQVAIDGVEDAIAIDFGAGGEIQGEAQISGLNTIHIPILLPGNWFATSSTVFLFTIGKEAPNGIIIDQWTLSCNVDPDVEINANLKYADAWIGLANAVVIDVLDTTNGTSSEDTDADINGGAVVPNGKVVYLEFDADPTGTCVQMIFEMVEHREED